MLQIRNSPFYAYDACCEMRNRQILRLSRNDDGAALCFHVLPHSNDTSRYDVRMDEALQHTKAREVLERLLLAHQAYFDVERDHEFAGRRFDGYAEFHSSASKYVLVKRAKLWEANSHEYMFITIIEHLDALTLEELVDFMTSDALDKISLERDHMCSFLTLIIVAETMDEELAAAVRRTRFRKNFLFGFKGWADLRLCVIDLAGERVIANGMGKELVPTLEANAFGRSV